MEKSYQIKKIMLLKGKFQHVILLNTQGEVFETNCFGEAMKICELMNANTDSGCKYEIVQILNNK
jgi:hypothetical protein